LYKIVARGTWYQHHFHANSGPDDRSSIALTDVPILDQQLAALAAVLRRWLAKPHEFHHDLSADASQLVEISLTVEPDKICSVEKPVFAFRCVNSSIVACARWVIDQTCVRILAESIESR